LQNIRHVVGVFFLLRQDVFKDPACGRVFVADVLDDFAVAVDCNPFRHQVLVDHFFQGLARHVLRMGVFGQVIGVELRLATQLHNALCKLVGVFHFLVGVLQELVGSHAGLEPVGHEVVALVTQHAHQFSGQGFVEQPQDFFAVGVIALGDGITDLYTHVVLDDGVLKLEPLRFGVAGGKLDAQINLNGRNTPLQGQAKLTARNFKLKQLFPTFEPMKTSFGELNGDASISGTGNSVASLLGTANGNLKMLINDGAISRSLMEIAGLNVGNYVVGKIFGDEEVKINCAAADFGIKNGLATSRLFVFDTQNAIIYIDGTANFATERLDLKITPESKGFRVFSLRSPLYVRGTFAHPDAGVEAVPLLLRGAGMVALGVIAGPAAGLLALVAPSGDVPNQCAPLLQQMQQGKVPKTVK